MKPAKARRVFAVVDSLVALAVILITPSLFPDGPLIGRDHAAFPSSVHDLILAEGKGTYIAQRAYGSPFISGSVTLSTILNHLQSVLACQCNDRVHITRPASQMHRDDGLGPCCQQRSDGFGSNVLAVRIDIGDNRFCTTNYHTTCRGNKRSARHDNFVTWANPQGVEREFQSDRSIGHSNAVLAACLRCKFLLEPPALFACPVIDLSRLQHASHRIYFVRLKMRPWCERGLADRLRTKDRQKVLA